MKAVKPQIQQPSVEATHCCTGNSQEGKTHGDMAHNVLYEGPGTCVWKDAGHEIESGRLLKENIEMSQKRLEGEGKRSVFVFI